MTNAPVTLSSVNDQLTIVSNPTDGTGNYAYEIQTFRDDNLWASDTSFTRPGRELITATRSAR